MNPQDRIDPQIQEILDQYTAFGAPLPTDLSPDAARNLPSMKNAVEEMISQNFTDRAATLVKPMPEPVGKVSHQVIEGKEGLILTRVYTPSGPGPFPVIVYFHGGGWVIANLDVYEPSCRALCNATNSIVISVAYRQAPEHKYPAAADDAYAALQWALKNAAEINGDVTKVAVAGESAGGNLAAVSCIRAKQEGGRMPVAQLLVYPITNYAFDTLSYQENANVKPLTKELMQWFWMHYLTNPEEGRQPYASPLLAESVSGMPPTMVITAELDVLRDEGEQYARKLQEAGVVVQQKRYPGMVHEFFSLSGMVDTAKSAVQDAASFLKAACSGEISAVPVSSETNYR